MFQDQITYRDNRLAYQREGITMDNELDALERQKLNTEQASPSLLGVRLRWQTEPPKVAGWYWINFNGMVSVREFDQPVIDQLAEEETKPEYKELAARCNFFWAGPIPKPEEAT